MLSQLMRGPRWCLVDGFDNVQPRMGRRFDRVEGGKGAQPQHVILL